MGRRGRGGWKKENRFDTDNQTVTTEIHNKSPSGMRQSGLLICSGGAVSQVVKQRPPGRHSTASTSVSAPLVL